MTEKEKAKAYDEAIERAKKLHNNGITEEIFPELKEDNDERIKKELIQWVDEFPDIIWRGHYKKDIIAWLEKQGKKSRWKPSKEEMDALYSLSYITNEYDEHKEDVITHLYQDLKREFFNDSSYENMFSLDNKEDEVRRRSTIQVLEYARSLDAYNQYGKADIDKNISWLETQGEQKPTLPKWKYKKDNTPLLRDSIILNKYGGVAKSPSGAIVSDVWVLDYDELAKLPKEEKIEPKFNVGDWIISSVLGTAHIIGTNDSNEFQLEYIDGKQKFSSIDYVNYAYDKWTINNVKDGDVLFTSSSACSDTFVFKSIDEKGNAECYFAYDSEDGFTEGKYHFIGSASDCKPATKVQCDFLMKAMKDARYEWDSEKKELKKLDLVPNKKPILGGLNMKTYNDINIGDTVYIWGTSDSSVDETTITEKYEDGGHWNLKFSNGCVGRALKNGTSSTMGMYACLVYSDKEAVRESINKQIKILSNIKI